MRFYEIDLLRFLAAFFVLANHYVWRLHAGDERISAVSFPELAGTAKYGLLGVQLFFLISGYVIMLSVQGKTVRQFFLSRITRLYPAFWVACTLTFFAQRLFGPPRSEPSFSWLGGHSVLDYLANMTMLHSFIGRPALDGVYWTISIELIFYVLIAILIGFNLLPHLRVVCFFWMLYIAAAGPTPGVESPLYVFLIAKYAPYFIGGMMFYLIQTKQGKAWKSYALLAFAYILCLRQAKCEMDALSLVIHEHMSGAVAMAACTIFFVVFYLVITRVINLQRFTWLSKLGNLTYPLYVTHAILGYLVYQHLGNFVNKYLLLVGLISVMILLAWLIHTFVEKKVARPLGQATDKLLRLLAKAN